MDRVFFVTIILTVTIFNGFTQDTVTVNKKLQMGQFLESKNLGIKKLEKEGFELHFNCDSVPFLRSTIGDTTKIWTASMISWYEQDELLDRIDKKKFGHTQYISSIGGDGRIELVDMHETTFINRHDSLYQMGRFTKPKLIFHPDMFSSGQSSVKLKKKFNYQGDIIVLGKKWVDNGIDCAYIIVTNKKEKTEYSFTFDKNLRFIYWENCKKRA